MRVFGKISVRPRIAAFLLVAAAFVVSFIGGCASAQPHMQSALDHLNAARSELDQALPNKGGHRERAIEFVNRAIQEVEQGINYARGR